MRIIKHLTLLAVLVAIGFLLGRMYYYYSPLYNSPDETVETVQK